MWIPGFGSEELKPYKKSATTEAHKQVGKAVTIYTFLLRFVLSDLIVSKNIITQNVYGFYLKIWAVLNLWLVSC